MRDTLVDAVRTTRKYGLGWLFISQTLASLPKPIIEQLRIMFFGFGLAYGRELESLKEIAGGSGSALDLYRSFRDPHSAFDSKSKQYNFMTVGPISPLSFSGTPLFFTAFNDPAEFHKVNGLFVPKGEAKAKAPSASRQKASVSAGDEGPVMRNAMDDGPKPRG